MRRSRMLQGEVSCQSCQVLPVLAAVSSTGVPGIAVPTLPTRVPLWETKAGKFWSKKDSFLCTCWATGDCMVIDQLVDKAVAGISCSVHISPELLCSRQSCPPSSITKENYSSTLDFVVWSKRSWVSFLRCIRSPSPKQKKVFVILWCI